MEKKRQKRSHQFQFHCGVLQTSTAQSCCFQLPSTQTVGKRKVFKKIQKTHIQTDMHTCHWSNIFRSNPMFCEQYANLSTRKQTYISLILNLKKLRGKTDDVLINTSIPLFQLFLMTGTCQSFGHYQIMLEKL